MANTYAGLTTKTRQTAPTDRATKQNLAGGYGFDMDPKLAVRRWLLTGSTGNAFYETAQAQTMGNVATLHEVMAQEPDWVAGEIVEASKKGLNIHTPIFALTHLSKVAPHQFRAIFNDVIRTASHLYEFCGYVDELRGFGQSIHKAVKGWISAHDWQGLEFQFLKYQSRYNWSVRDVLRKFKPKPRDLIEDALFAWAAGKGNWGAKLAEAGPEALLRLRAYDTLVHYPPDARTVAKMINELRLSREMIPATIDQTKVIRGALFDQMPVGATIRNLGQMTHHEVLRLGGLGGSGVDNTRLEALEARLTNPDNLRKAFIHPVALASAAHVYETGGVLGRSKLTWNPLKFVVDVLDTAYKRSFAEVEPTGATILHAIDVSGSMSYRQLEPLWLTPSQTAGLMAVATMRSEKFYDVVGFDTNVHKSPFTKQSTLSQIMGYTGPGGGTDCTLPIRYAMASNTKFDAIVIWSDGVFWAGDAHLYQVFREYKKKMNPQAKLIMVNMVAYSDNTSLVDPEDPAMFDVVGFTADTPKLIHMLTKGEV